jgi:Holliday junction resolvase RusA-like endonuclease
MLHEAERHPKAYNDMKRQYQFLAINAIRRDLRGYKAQGLVRLHYTFGEPRKGNKRDYDNIVAAGRKIINDALVKTGIIKDDSPRYLGYGDNSFEYVDVPYIRVEIEEVETPEHLDNFQ